MNKPHIYLPVLFVAFASHGLFSVPFTINGKDINTVLRSDNGYFALQPFRKDDPSQQPITSTVELMIKNRALTIHLGAFTEDGVAEINEACKAFAKREGIVTDQPFEAAVETNLISNNNNIESEEVIILAAVGESSELKVANAYFKAPNVCLVAGQKIAIVNCFTPDSHALTLQGSTPKAVIQGIHFIFDSNETKTPRFASGTIDMHTGDTTDNFTVSNVKQIWIKFSEEAFK